MTNPPTATWRSFSTYLETALLEGSLRRIGLCEGADAGRDSVLGCGVRRERQRQRRSGELLRRAPGGSHDRRGPLPHASIRESLGPQLTSLAGLAYSFDMNHALALVASLLVEGNATIDGRLAAATSRRVLTLTAAGVLPLADGWRLQASAFVNPPLSGLARNFPASTGGALTVVVSSGNACRSRRRTVGTTTVTAVRRASELMGATDAIVFPPCA